MTMHNAEQIRQHNDYKAIQARLWGKKTAETKAEPVVVKEPKRKLIQLDYHVWLYRKFKIRYGAFVTTRASFSVTPYQNYTPYEPRVVFDMEPVRKTMKQIALEVLDIYPGVSLAELQPRIFSFNSPHGACPRAFLGWQRYCGRAAQKCRRE